MNASKRRRDNRTHYEYCEYEHFHEHILIGMIRRLYRSMYVRRRDLRRFASRSRRASLTPSCMEYLCRVPHTYSHTRTHTSSGGIRMNGVFYSVLKKCMYAIESTTNYTSKTRFTPNQSAKFFSHILAPADGPFVVLVCVCVLNCFLFWDSHAQH